MRHYADHSDMQGLSTYPPIPGTENPLVLYAYVLKWCCNGDQSIDQLELICKLTEALGTALGVEAKS